MGTISKYNDADAITRLVIEHLDIKDDVELRVDEYGKDMYLISVGKMSNPLELRAVSFSMQVIFMTDDEIEDSLDKLLDSLHSHFVERDMLVTEKPADILNEDIVTALHNQDVSEEIIDKLRDLIRDAS